MPQELSEEQLYAHALNLTGQIGPQRFKKLLRDFGSFKNSYTARAADLEDSGLNTNIIERLIEQRQNYDPKQEQTKLNQDGIKIVLHSDENFPELLRSIPNPPMLLYYRGELRSVESCLAIVGTRQFDDYGRYMTEKISQDLAKAGLTIVSGLANGIDALAHQSCLKVNGRTIAVLPSGISQTAIYPRSNLSLAQEIIQQGGLLLSEHSGETRLYDGNFITRNRLISGLAKGLIIIQCSNNSGAMSTAKHAQDQQRPCYAVPGSIFNLNSAGPHQLIRSGARLITSAEDVLTDLGLSSLINKAAASTMSLTTQQKFIFRAITKNQPISLAEIIKQTALPASEILATLTVLEMSSLVRQNNNEYLGL